ncbi:hypothetical protein R1flu_000784 [Riccia fluitans]|uniref:Uncharacterized protein n=1 Tax=Riccia fluitans TaxID=41844 RepID=A0ABD1Y1E1_9MARC
MGVSSAQGKDVENTKRASEEFKKWSSCLEDLLHSGKVDGTVKLLKKVVESLQLSDDAAQIYSCLRHV